MNDSLEELINLLSLEQLDLNVFRAFHPQSRKGRLFGGQIMAQALMAASMTVPKDRSAHSLHGYFMRPGTPDTPALIKVERIRDGKSFTTRRIVVLQLGEAIFSMDASFQKEEEGFDHQLSKPDLEPPGSEKIPEGLKQSPFITWRHEFRRLQSETPQPPEQFVWFKCNGEVSENPILNQCLLVYESDTALLGTCRLPHRGKFEREKMQVASLDHAMWFHRPISLNQWFLYSIDSPSTSSARGYTRGSIFTETGVLVASTAQEGLIRLVN